MHRHYSLDFKQQALKIFNSTGDINYVLETFGICRRTLFYWLKKDKANELAGKFNENRKGNPYKIDRDKLDSLLNSDEGKDMTLKEIANVIKVTPPAIYYFFRRNGIKFKKNSHPTKKVIQ
jgi:transposase